VAVGLTSQLEVGGVGARLVEGARRLFEADRVALLLPRPDGRLSVEARFGLDLPEARAVAELPTLVAMAAPDASEPVVLLRGLADERPASDVAGLAARLGCRSLAACPLHTEGEYHGVMAILHDRPCRWTAPLLAALGIVAAGAAVALSNARTYERMRTWAAQLHSIQQLGTRLGRLSTVADIGTAICAELRQLIDYHNVRVYRVVGEDVIPVAWRGEIGEYLGESGEELRLKVGNGITGWVAQHGVAQYLPDAARDPRSWTIPGTEDDLDESMLLAPMLYEDRVIGVIVLSKLGLGQFGSDDLRYLAIYASIAAQAMVNADATERMRTQSEILERRLESQRQLLSVTESILSNLDPVEVVEGIADRLGGLIPVDDMGIAVRDADTRRLRPLLARGTHARYFMDHPFPDDSGLVGWVVEHGQTRLVQGPAIDAPDTPVLGLGIEPGALVLAPLRAGDRTFGVLSLERHGPGASFSPDEFELVRLFAGHVSIALQNALAHQAVELRAQTDALTGLKNHGTFSEDVARAVKAGARFSLLMIDLDDFKAFNDVHGHEAGNDLLRGIARALLGACRDADDVYRYGGDEFTVLLPGARAASARGVAERVRTAVRDVTRTVDPAARTVTCSIGLASYPADARDQAPLLLAADRACYAAKRSGGDSVVTAAEASALGVAAVLAPTPVDDPSGRDSGQGHARDRSLRPAAPSSLGVLKAAGRTGLAARSTGTVATARSGMVTGELRPVAASGSAMVTGNLRPLAAAD
jgi:diguanylate cyclase (GGDEF)-like protein